MLLRTDVRRRPALQGRAVRHACLATHKVRCQLGRCETGLVLQAQRFSCTLFALVLLSASLLVEPKHMRPAGRPAVWHRADRHSRLPRQVALLKQALVGA